MHFAGERLDALAQLVGDLRQPGVLLEQRHQLRPLFGGQGHALFVRRGEVFPMLRVGIGMGLVAVRLPGLRQQNEGRGIGGLETEREIEEDEGINVELGEAENIQADPDDDDGRLPHQKKRGAKKTGEGLRLQREPIVAEDPVKVNVRQVEAQMML